MKAAMNGVLNLSVLDGWWPEAYDGDNGWAITAGQYYEQPELKEVAEANQIYDLLEADITEMYYDRSEVGLPTHWVEMMRNSIATACSGFNMNRVLADYARQYYIPAKRQLQSLSANDYEMLRKAFQGRDALLNNWDRVVIRDLFTTVDRKDHVCQGEKVEVRCMVDFHGAPADAFGVELYLSQNKVDEFTVIPMTGGEMQGHSRPYTCSFDIVEHGLLSMNVRLRPADPSLRDSHPELIKWAQ